jgi:hypothetical protein
MAGRGDTVQRRMPDILLYLLHHWLVTICMVVLGVLPTQYSGVLQYSILEYFGVLRSVLVKSYMDRHTHAMCCHL